MTYIRNSRRQSVSELKTPEKVRIIHELNYSSRNIEVLAKRHSVNPRVIRELQQYSLHDVFDKSNSWNPKWDNSDYIFHPNENPEQKVSLSKSGDYDAINDGFHFKWSDLDCLKLCMEIFDRSVEAVKDSAVGSDTYNLGLETINSDLMKIYFKYEGLDHEEFVSGLLRSKQEYDEYWRNASERLSSLGSSDEDELLEHSSYEDYSQVGLLDEVEYESTSNVELAIS